MTNRGPCGWLACVESLASSPHKVRSIRFHIHIFSSPSIHPSFTTFYFSPISPYKPILSLPRILRFLSPPQRNRSLHLVFLAQIHTLYCPAYPPFIATHFTPSTFDSCLLNPLHLYKYLQPSTATLCDSCLFLSRLSTSLRPLYPYPGPPQPALSNQRLVQR